ncbi:MAG: MBL fold metallo-hydrolase [Candidatus Pacebacteria bacterium]|nr:MBL fold metallo-hydrolase [Candidatus Paceibacterota bacterium]MBP9842698.1 MBL fold metallo-hydrolase [Candidatus Paceibacterota bacterium]
MNTTLGFYGGVGSVTGANFMLDTGKVAILVDCGLVQGSEFASEINAKSFVYNPAEVDVLIVTHAHADHIGRIPKLVRDGFKGVIYSTEPTRSLARFMFEDALKIMEMEARRDNRETLYGAEDIEQAFTLWKTKAYKESFELPDGIIASFHDAGHILGSAMVWLERNGKRVVFTGDIGNVPQPLMGAPEIPQDYDYMVMESVYGDRSHEEVDERTELLKGYIQETIRTKGTLIIPAFSLERTQGMLLEINNLIESKQIGEIKTFLDSPLAIRVTEVYRKSVAFMKEEVQKQIERGDDIFEFDGLKFTETVKESSQIARTSGAKIIIAGSGMSHGGRIRAHEKEYLDDTNCIVLLVGYQSVGSIGRLLQDGAKQVFIDGMKVKVKARIATIRGFSGHADRDQLVDLVHGGLTKQTKQIFVTMGEERSSLFLTQRLRDYLGAPAIAPEENAEIEIDF